MPRSETYTPEEHSEAWKRVLNVDLVKYGACTVLFDSHTSWYVLLNKTHLAWFDEMHALYGAQEIN